jgi:hypothetical protein
MPRPRRRPAAPRPPFARLAALALAALVALGRPEAASAWGRLGHRASAQVAYGLLSPKARRAVDALLEPGESLADAATWADEVRRERPGSGPWHYINVPVSEPHVAMSFCPEDQGCVLSAIAEQARILDDESAPEAERREALRFLVHLIQDLHQPLHVGDREDRGGNDLQVQFLGQGSNLHRVWDGGLLETRSDDELAWADDLVGLLLEQKDRIPDWQKGNVRDWAEESFQAAKKAYIDPANGRALEPGARLGGEYQAENLTVARERLARSAVRVARVLNEIFG